MLAAVVTACGATTGHEELKVTSEGVGILTFGCNVDQLPSSVEGMYDRIESVYDDFIGCTMHYLYLGDKLQYEMGYDDDIVTITVKDPNVDLGGYSVGDPVSEVLKLNPKQEITNSGLQVSLNGCYLWFGGLNQSGQDKQYRAYSDPNSGELRYEESDFEPSATLENATINIGFAQ